MLCTRSRRRRNEGARTQVSRWYLAKGVRNSVYGSTGFQCPEPCYYKCCWQRVFWCEGWRTSYTKDWYPCCHPQRLPGELFWHPSARHWAFVLSERPGSVPANPTAASSWRRQSRLHKCAQLLPHPDNIGCDCPRRGLCFRVWAPSGKDFSSTRFGKGNGRYNSPETLSIPLSRCFLSVEWGEERLGGRSVYWKGTSDWRVKCHWTSLSTAWRGAGASSSSGRWTRLPREEGVPQAQRQSADQ